MSAAGRDGLTRVFGSPEYLEWASRARNLIDARKLASEYAGVRKPTCGSKYAQGLQILCRENPPITPIPPPGTIPAPFSGRGIVLLEPTGGVENMEAVKAAGFTYVMLNIAYVRGGTWDTVRQRCAPRGITVVPWRRVRGPEDSAQIEQTAALWGSVSTAHNLETEAVTTYPPVNMASYVKQNYPPRVRAVITEPWAQNNAGWQHLADWVGMPEAFLNADPRFEPAVLVDHIEMEGIPRSVPLFGWGAWSDAPTYVSPAEYLSKWPTPRPYAVYFGDSREQQYKEWLR
jgi:hypothetical protein